MEHAKLARPSPADVFLERMGMFPDAAMNQGDVSESFGPLFELAEEGLRQSTENHFTASMYMHVLTAVANRKDPVRYLRGRGYQINNVSSAVLTEATACWLEDTARQAQKEEPVIPKPRAQPHEVAVAAEVKIELSELEEPNIEIMDGIEDDVLQELAKPSEAWVDSTMSELSDFLPEEPASPMLLVKPLWRQPQEVKVVVPRPRSAVLVKWPNGMVVPGLEDGSRFKQLPEEPTEKEQRENLTNRACLPKLIEAEEEEDWRKRAICSQTDPEAFFPERGASPKGAKRICQGCEVKEECLKYALDNDERFGVWGGLSEQERRKVKKRVTG